jgi:NOL1/NOP2/fmu family ribosome biogenesis protein
MHPQHTHQQNTIGSLRILNSKETKHIIEKLSEQYGYDYDKASQEYAFLMNKDNRIYIVSRTIEILPYDEMKIDSIGMYFGELYKESLRMSIEGSQMIGPKSSKNVIDIDTDQMIEWIKGNDIEHEDVGKEFVIIKHTDKDTTKVDYFGAGRYKDGKIMNFVSKSRRLIVVNN